MRRVFLLALLSPYGCNWGAAHRVAAHYADALKSGASATYGEDNRTISDPVSLEIPLFQGFRSAVALSWLPMLYTIRLGCTCSASYMSHSDESGQHPAGR